MNRVMIVVDYALEINGRCAIINSSLKITHRNVQLQLYQL